MRMSALLPVLLVLAGCEREAAVPTSEENAQMDDAANMLDQAPANLEGVDDSALVGSDGSPAANADRIR